MICIIMLARGPFVEGSLHAWNITAIPLAGSSLTRRFLLPMVSGAICCPIRQLG
jgi:hypothetical protein